MKFLEGEYIYAYCVTSISPSNCKRKRKNIFLLVSEFKMLKHTILKRIFLFPVALFIHEDRFDVTRVLPAVSSVH